MTVSQETLVFFDTSCLIAATGSPSGGSGFILSLCRRGLLQGAVSQPVLLEAEGNIARKLGVDALARFTQLLVESLLVVAPVPDAAAREQYRVLAGPKDDHVVAAAVAINAAYRSRMRPSRCCQGLIKGSDRNGVMYSGDVWQHQWYASRSICHRSRTGS